MARRRCERHHKEGSGLRRAEPTLPNGSARIMSVHHHRKVARLAPNSMLRCYPSRLELFVLDMRALQGPEKRVHYADAP